MRELGMDGLIGRHRSIVIDTNMLLVLLAYDCLERARAGAVERLRILTEVRGREDYVPAERYDDLWMLFRSASKRIVTQHVIAEVHGLRKKLRRLHRDEFSLWDAGAWLLLDNEIDEFSCTVSDLYRHQAFCRILREIGPTDAGLLFVAQKEKCTVLTDDGKLAQWGSTQRVPCLNLRDMEAALSNIEEH